MSYHRRIYRNLKTHFQNLKNIGKKEILQEKVLTHFENTKKILEIVKGKKPIHYRAFIDYLYQETRNFGCSFPERIQEEKCEKEFWKFKESIRKIILEMNTNERLYFFGYFEEYERIKPIERSAREMIELKLFLR